MSRMSAFLSPSRALSACAAVILGFHLAGCQTLDKVSYEPRSYQVNLGTQNLREELILLNVVRASRFEPLNFTTLSKYTASGTLGAGGNMQRNIGVDFQIFRNGLGAQPNSTLVGSSPANALTATGSLSMGNSFDVAPLDNSDFYENFLATLTPELINTLVNAGLSREAVFHSLIGSIDINLTASGQSLVTPASIKHSGLFTTLRFENDPSNNTWPGMAYKQASEECERQATKDHDAAIRLNHGRWAPFYTNFWHGAHLKDCHYRKFLSLIEAAFEYGVTTTAVPKPQGQKNATSSAASNSGLAAKSNQQRDIILCFDPAIAANNRHPVSSKSSCAKHQGKEAPGTQAASETLLSQPLSTGLGAYDRSMQPVLRSPYGVFQYYGKLLRTKTDVKLPPESQRETGDGQLFKVTPGAAGCFVHVGYGGHNFCVPEDGAATTKEVLTLLIALVNLSTVRGSLPYTSSVISQRQ